MPTGGRFSAGDVPLSARWVEQAFDLVHYERMPRGGHFAAMEEPDLLVADIREFFRT